MSRTELGITELDLLSFFGAEPVSRIFGEKWYDSDSVYEYADQMGRKLTFAIHPIHRDVRVRIYFDDDVCFDWQAVGVENVVCIDDSNRMLIEVRVASDDITTIQLMPAISVVRKSGSVDRQG